MSKKLFIGGLPYSTTDTELQTAFAQAGTVVSATVIHERETGRSKGFGFVEMSSDEEAQAAIDLWNGKDFDGRNIIVNIARPMEERPPRREFDRGGDRGGYGNRGGNNDRGGYGGGYGR